MTTHHLARLTAAALAAAACIGAQAQTGASAPAGASAPMATATATKLARADHRFIEQAAMGGMAEVQMGQMAQQKGASDTVKQFGARMVQDHGKANGELKQLAAAKGVTLPAALDRSHQKDADKLGKLSGAEFDRAYMSHMVSDHKKDVSDFKKAADDAKDADLKAWAGKTLPTLEEHLKMATAGNDAVKGQK